MNRKQLRAKKAYERKHALEIAWRHALVCVDLDNNDNYVRVTDPIMVDPLHCAVRQSQNKFMISVSYQGEKRKC